MKAYIQRIRDAIEAQNYTYAEDMILRLSAGDTGVGIDLLEEDYLKLFWKEFEQNYYATAGASRSLEYKYERFQRENKDTRAARSRITLWLSNGGHMGEERIQKLMNMLGFPVERALEKPRIVEKIENDTELKAQRLACRERAVADFDKERCFEKYIELYDELTQ